MLYSSKIATQMMSANITATDPNVRWEAYIASLCGCLDMRMRHKNYACPICLTVEKNAHSGCEKCLEKRANDASKSM